MGLECCCKGVYVTGRVFVFCDGMGWRVEEGDLGLLESRLVPSIGVWFNGGSLM
jgi:hypothetical protein